MRKTNLTEEEKKYLSDIACDLQTGNHLIHPRSDEYKTHFQMFCDAVNEQEPTEKQKEIKEYVHQCTCYHYWKNLPDDEKMF